MKNIGLKLFCLAVAVLLARFVHNRDSSSVVSVLAPLEIQGLPAGKVIIWPLTRQVQVTVQGPSFLLGRLAQSPPVLRVQLPERVDYRFSAKLSEHLLSVNPAIRVVGIEPPAIDFRLDDIVSRTLPVIVPRIGQLPENHLLEALSVTPAAVVVEGPKTEVADLDRVETPPVDLRGLVTSTEIPLTLQGPGKLSRVEPSEVRVALTVSVVNVTRTFPKVPVEIRAAPGQVFQIAPGEVDVSVQGPKVQVEALAPGDVVAFVRPNGPVEAEQLPVKIELPQGVRLARVDPARVVLARREGTPLDATRLAGTPVAGTPVAGTPVAGTPVSRTPAAGGSVGGTAGAPQKAAVSERGNAVKGASHRQGGHERGGEQGAQ